MLSLEHIPWSNKDWEDLEKVSKMWTKCCKIYKKSELKETIRIQDVGKEAEQFGGTALGGDGRGDKPPAGCPHPATMED